MLTRPKISLVDLLSAMEFLIEDTKKQILISNFQRQKKYFLNIPKFKQE
jgi:hypothetical protein